MLGIKKIRLYTDPSRTFGWDGEVIKYDQHPNQQCGIDKYVSLKNFITDEAAFKKLYENGKGLHFKSREGTFYLKDFKDEVLYIPSQVVEL